MFTNIHNLPEELASALTENRYSKGDATYSVTELLQPVQLWRLSKLYPESIKIDVSERIWAVFGSAVHKILSEQETGAVLEQRLKVQLSKDISLSGQIDVMKLQDDKLIINDYKVTSVYKYRAQDYDDWTFQLNVYNYLAQMNLPSTYDKVELNIVAILRDWSHKEANKENQYDNGHNLLPYPPIQVQVIQIPVWDDLKTLTEILNKIKKFEEVKNILYLDNLPPCTDEERWKRGYDYYAVYNPAKDNVYRKFEITPERSEYEAEQEAIKVLSTMKATGYEIKRFEAEPMRCRYFCPVRDICPQNQGSLPKADIILDTTTDLTIPEA